MQIHIQRFDNIIFIYRYCSFSVLYMSACTMPRLCFCPCMPTCARNIHICIHIHIEFKTYLWHSAICCHQLHDVDNEETPIPSDVSILPITMMFYQRHYLN